MLRCPDESDTPALYAANTQATFWRPMVEIAADTWVQEAAGLASDIPGAAEALASGGWPGLMCYLLGEGQFGTGHWTLSRMRRTYYRYLRPIIPSWLKPLVRGALARRQCRGGSLLWPVEGRYVDLQFRLFAAVLRRWGGFGALCSLLPWADATHWSAHDVEGGRDRLRPGAADLKRAMA